MSFLAGLIIGHFFVFFEVVLLKKYKPELIAKLVEFLIKR